MPACFREFYPEIVLPAAGHRVVDDLAKSADLLLHFYQVVGTEEGRMNSNDRFLVKFVDQLCKNRRLDIHGMIIPVLGSRTGEEEKKGKVFAFVCQQCIIHIKWISLPTGDYSQFFFEPAGFGREGFDQ